jgi:hypothetical protein
MKKLFAAALISMFATTTATFAVEPIPGSLTFPTDWKTTLREDQVGGPLNHQYRSGQTRPETHSARSDRDQKHNGKQRGSGY